ncbi:exonuclease domain-containing protein [Maribacter sp. 2308TA10-17]|uniref:exonuclease domain-containing protein n=1 Tax=Maribacter sp. 2308TA10-17 TaxID=3386276 RepID=UPI0039BC4761
MLSDQQTIRLYTIIDIETTGNGIKGNKITEIAIFKYDGYEIVEEYTSLVNPECEIPYFITGLTGIDNQMVRDAPTIDQIADEILEITKDTIFVAHSVNFDYNVIKNEFKNIGREFVRKKLCTVRLSRKLIPGYNSYSLGKLCSALGIPLTDRHRARGDAHATTLLFEKLLRAEGAEAVFKTFLNARSQEATLPPALSREVYEKLPEVPGIYFFKNAKGAIIYVGKAINIKKRVLGHFYDKSTKEIEMCQETANIDFELSGSELVALLMESDAIKHHYPPFNRAQKRTIQQYAIFSYEDRKGIMHLAHNKLKAAPNPLMIYYSTTDCRAALQEICKTFELCPKYCHLQEGVEHCSHYSITNCGGICRGKEKALSYNERVLKAIQSLKGTHQNFVIQEKGRTLEEQAFIWIENGRYAGYGFVQKEETIHSYDDLETFLIRKKNTLEAQRILQSYLLKNPEKEKFLLTAPIL